MGMSFIGSYSGIDQNTIDQLMQAERMPLKHLESKKVNIGEKQNAWKDVNTRLNSLYEKMNALKNANSFETKIAKSSDDKFVSMTAGTNVAEGKYTVKIDQLATNTSLIGSRLDSSSDTLDLNGKFVIINNDLTEKTIDVESTDSLKDIVEKINLATNDSKDEKGEIIKGSGISATIVDNRIVLNDEKTGARGIALEGIDGFDLDKIGLETNKMINIETGEIVESEGKAVLNTGQQAEFTLNGIKINRDINIISDAIDGITINLNKVHLDGQSDTIVVSNDDEKATKLVQDFVDQYNSTMQFIDEKTKAGDPKVEGSKGILSGESSLVRLQSSLRRAVTGIVGSDKEGINVASKLGITTTDKSGKLSFDKSKFLEALKDDKDGVMNFLNPKEEGKVGLVSKVNNLIDSFISKENGVIKSQNESFERTLKTLSSRIEQFEDRMERKEAYYVKTFTALDVAMMKAEDQMGWLIGQVDAMNAGKR